VAAPCQRGAIHAPGNAQGRRVRFFPGSRREDQRRGVVSAAQHATTQDGRPAILRRVIAVGRARSPCPALAKSGSTMTLAGCGACSPRIARKSCVRHRHHHGGRWWWFVPKYRGRQSAPRPPACSAMLTIAAIVVGIDRGLSAFCSRRHQRAVPRFSRVDDAPRALRAAMTRQRHLARSCLTREGITQSPPSLAARLGRHHHHVANVRRHVLQPGRQRAGQDPRTGSLLRTPSTCPECWPTTRLAQAVSDAGWAEEFADSCATNNSGGVGRWSPRTAGTRRASLCSVCGTIQSEVDAGRSGCSPAAAGIQLIGTSTPR